MSLESTGVELRNKCTVLNAFINEKERCKLNYLEQSKNVRAKKGVIK